MGDITSTLEESSDSGRRLKISVPAFLLEEKEKELLEKYAKELALDGFRKGKVPKSIIEKRYAASLKGEALEDVCKDAYFSVIKERGIAPLTRAEIEDVKQEKKRLSFTASFEVIPEIDVDYRDLVIKLPFREVGEEDIEKVVENMRLSYANYIPVVRVSAPGDYMVVDYSYMKEVKGILRPERVTNFGFILGSDKVIEEFNKNLIGKRPGENINLKVRYPIDFSDTSVAGREVAYKVRVNEVKEIRLPTLDKEFAKTCGFDDLNELRENIKKNLVERLDAQVKDLLPSLVLNELLKRHTFEPPKVFVDIALDSLKEEIRDEKIEGMDEIQVKNRAMIDAKVRTMLTVIADKENISVTDEEVRNLLRESLKPGEIKSVLEDRERREYLRSYYRRNKALHFLTEQARVEYLDKN